MNKLGVNILKVQCVLCDHVHNLDDHCFTAKRLRNQQGKMYLCTTCDERITLNTQKRHETGDFDLYRKKRSENEILID